MSFCSNCGKGVSGEANFCSNCGKEILFLSEDILEKPENSSDTRMETESRCPEAEAIELAGFIYTDLEQSSIGKLSERQEAFRNLSASSSESKIYIPKPKKMNFFMLIAVISSLLLLAFFVSGQRALSQEKQIQKSFNQAKAIFNKEQYSLAEAELRNFLDQHPESKQAEEAKKLITFASEEAEATRELQKEAEEKKKIADKKAVNKKVTEQKKAAKQHEKKMSEFDWYNGDFGVTYGHAEHNYYGLLTIEGTAVPLNRDYDYVQITFGIYAPGTSTKIGGASANINYIDKGSKWKYKAIGTVNTTDRFEYIVEDITGW